MLHLSVNSTLRHPIFHPRCNANHHSSCHNPEHRPFQLIEPRERPFHLSRFRSDHFVGHAVPLHHAQCVPQQPVPIFRRQLLQVHRIVRAVEPSIIIYMESYCCRVTYTVSVCISLSTVTACGVSSSLSKKGAKVPTNLHLFFFRAHFRSFS